MHAPVPEAARPAQESNSTLHITARASKQSSHPIAQANMPACRNLQSQEAAHSHAGQTPSRHKEEKHPRVHAAQPLTSEQEKQPSRMQHPTPSHHKGKKQPRAHCSTTPSCHSGKKQPMCMEQRCQDGRSTACSCSVMGRSKHAAGSAASRRSRAPFSLLSGAPTLAFSTKPAWGHVHASEPRRGWAGSPYNKLLSHGANDQSLLSCALHTKDGLCLAGSLRNANCSCCK